MAIADRLTPEKIRELGREYEVKLTGLLNTTPDQWFTIALVGMGTFVLAIVLAFFVVPAWIPFYRYSGFGQLLVFIAICVLPLIRTRWFLRFVPKYTLVQATDYFTGGLHTFTPGAHLKGPQYLAGPSDYIDTRLIVIEGKTAFVTKEGVVVTYGWTTQSRIIAQLLGLNTRISLEDMALVVGEVVENTLSTGFLGKSTKTLRDPQKVREMERRLIGKLNAPLPEWTTTSDEEVSLDSDNNPVWVRFGQEFEIATLGAPDFEPTYKQALTAKAVADMINETAKKFVAEFKASPDAALNSALIINKAENVQRNILAVEGIDKALSNAAVSVMRVFRKK